MEPRALVALSYAELCEPEADLSTQIEAAFGPDGLGIVVVNDVPEYATLRATLLPLASRLAALPREELAALEDAESTWNFGWSHGKERLESGRNDTAKGSFYANPLLDAPTDDPELVKRFPHYCRPNLWPSKSLPELEGALKACGALIVRVGLLLAAHCDAYVRTRGGAAAAAQLRQTIANSRCPKSRLLHYFPVAPESAAEQAPEADVSSWCGWHLDHGSLTGLTCAQYMDASGREVPCPDPAAGLYIRARGGEVVRASFRADQLAFQMGQATQVTSGGLLRATPHCVRAAGGPAAAGIARNTFAVFLQPQWDAPMDAPPDLNADDTGMQQFKPGMLFGEFASVMLATYH